MVIRTNKKKKKQRRGKGKQGTVLDGVVWKSFLEKVMFNLVCLAGKWGVSAKGYGFLWRVVKMFKIDCDVGHTAPLIY